MKNVFLLLATLTSFNAFGALNSPRGTTDVGSSEKSSYSGISLYAECEVKSCTVVGGPVSADLYCAKHGLNVGNATIQIFRYESSDESKKQTGILGFVYSGDFEKRAQSYYTDIRIQDGAQSMQISSVEGKTFRNFTINYSTKSQPVTTGHLDMDEPYQGESASIELKNCHSVQE